MAALKDLIEKKLLWCESSNHFMSVQIVVSIMLLHPLRCHWHSSSTSDAPKGEGLNVQSDHAIMTALRTHFIIGKQRDTHVKLERYGSWEAHVSLRGKSRKWCSQEEECNVYLCDDGFNSWVDCDHQWPWVRLNSTVRVCCLSKPAFFAPTLSLLPPDLPRGGRSTIVTH